jgi:hypothetical protein
VVLQVLFALSIFSGNAFAYPCAQPDAPFRGPATSDYQEAQAKVRAIAKENSIIAASYLVKSMMESNTGNVLSVFKTGRVAGDPAYLKGTKIGDYLSKNPSPEEQQALIAYLLKASQMVGTDKEYAASVILYVEGKLARKESLTELSNCDTDDPLYLRGKLHKMPFPKAKRPTVNFS